jgi:hypothetical protein
MCGTLKLHQQSRAEIGHLKGEKAVVTGLQVEGKGKIFFCLLNFFNEGDTEPLLKDLYFANPDFASAQVLLPRTRDFKISGYDFCTIKIINGTIEANDNILLTYQCDGYC